MNNTTLQHALHYAALGIPVMPLHYLNAGVCSCGKPKGDPKCKPGKHPFGSLVPHGLTDATTDADVVRQWFDGMPYNLGICTGEISGFFALDRDDRDGGDRSLAELEVQNSPLPATLAQHTGNGVHYLFKMPQGTPVKNSVKLLAPGLDIRGTGGYIVAAPSIHENGRTYTWMTGTLPSREQIADAPRWLLDLIEKSGKPKNDTGSSDRGREVFANEFGSNFSWPDKIEDGEGREDFIIRAAGHLRATGASQATIERALLDFNQLHIAPPLDNTAILDRARRYHVADPVQAANDAAVPEPQPLAESLPPVPSFSTKLLPKVIGAYVTDVAERMSCPPDFPGIAAVIALGAAIGSRIHCKPYSQGTWMVPAGAWGMVVSAPSAIKSPPLSELLRPLYEMDKKAAEAYRLALEKYQIDKAIYDHALKAAIRGGAPPVGLVAPVEPVMTRYIVNDSTYEMLVTIAAANPNGFLVWRDELVGWFYSLNKENQKEARGLYLTGWSGTEGYATDRIGRGHVRADRVNLSLLGTIQPNVLRQIVYDAVSGGGGDDGLVARFQLAVYPDSVRTYVKVDRQPDLQAMQHYQDLIQRLAHLDPAAVGASFTHDGIAYLPFDEPAQLVFDNWRQALEDRIRAHDSDEHPAMLAHLGKYRSLFPKLALILHLAAGQTGPIGVNAAMRAKVWTQYLEAHARRIYHTATNRTMQSAVALANKIKAGRLADGFTKSDVLTKDWVGLRTADEVGTALTVLRDMNWLTVIEDRRTGGRPAERFYISPKVKRAA
jgi:putative DNA primase/helicase